MLAQLASAATFGFGASFGRDLYQAARRNPVVAVLIGALLLCLGWRNLFLGEGRGLLYRFFVTLIGSLLMIAIGGALVAAGTVCVIGMTRLDTSWMWIVGGCLIALLSLIGIFWGLGDRNERRAATDLERRNLQFLEQVGLRDSEFGSDLVEDKDGNRLKLIEQAADKIVFSVVGRRGLRAAITIENGAMVNYSGIVKLS